MVYRIVRRFLKEDRAQDLIEYTLLLAFLSLVTVGVMGQTGSGLKGIWGGASSTIAVANSGGPASPPPSGGDGGGHGDRDGNGR